MQNLDALRATEGRVAFATADISSTMPGYDGAVQSGITAAADAVASRARSVGALGEKHEFLARTVGGFPNIQYFVSRLCQADLELLAGAEPQCRL